MSPPAPDGGHAAAEGSGGAGHLSALALEARPAGGAAEARAREYAADVLRDAGFAVTESRFTYSAFPGRHAMPVAGVLGACTVLGSAAAGLASGTPWHAAAILAAGLGIIALFARAMLGDAVLDLTFLRAASVNLVATRGASSPRVWLVAHLDSKSQPVPSAVRIAGVILLGTSIAVALLCASVAVLQLPVAGLRTGWWAAAVLASVGSPAVIASVVGARSDGAVDNASGVAAVLSAAARVERAVPLGVLLPSAEELGLAGARAFTREWARANRPGTAINCDGVDDRGEMTMLYSGTRPAALLALVRRVSAAPVRARRMPPGLRTDSVAFDERGWSTATLSRGGWATLRRIHTRLDSLASLRGTGIEPAATLLVRALEALA